MILKLTHSKDLPFYRLGMTFLMTAFLVTSLGIWDLSQAQTVFNLPEAGRLVQTSPSFKPLEFKGILVNTKNPLRFDFLIDKGDSRLSKQELKNEIVRLSKYFLTSLTVPENDMWVNLSPYEKDRTIPGNFGYTMMGRDLLAQDYLLKQIMASLSYPESDLGRLFWQRVYRKASELYGTTDIPINTFNKVWILPKSAQIYVQGNSAFVVKSRLDVMLEADYKAFVHHQVSSQKANAYSQIFRDIILPELREEINEGKNFAIVRQAYNAMILAAWYKRHLKDTFLSRIYVGKNKVLGIDIGDKHAKEKIFQQYLRAYKKCVYNYIKEDYDPLTNQSVPRKYASGGEYFSQLSRYVVEMKSPEGFSGNNFAMATINLIPKNNDGSLVSLLPAQDAAMNSFTSLMRKMILPFVLVLAFATSAPSINAQQIVAGYTQQVGGSTDIHSPEYLHEQALRERVRIEAAEAKYKHNTLLPNFEVPQRSKDGYDQDAFLTKFSLGFLMLVSLIGARVYGYTLPRFSFNRKSKNTIKKSSLISAKPKGQKPPLMLNKVADKDKFLDVTMPPPSASASESRVLRDDLKKMELLAAGKIAKTGPIPAEEDASISDVRKENLAFMDLASLLTVAGLSIVDGGISLSLVWAHWWIPAMTRIYYNLFQLIHEWFHLRKASRQFPGNGKKIWTLKNIMGNKSSLQWLLSMLPFTFSKRAYVYLPFAKYEGSEENKSKNRKIARAGFIGSAFLGATLVLTNFLTLGFNPLLAIITLSTLRVLWGSYKSGDLTGSQDTNEGLFGCGISVLVKRVPMQGIRKKDMEPLITGAFDALDTLTVRGGQQAGAGSSYRGIAGQFINILLKITKSKRNWLPWQTWDEGFVFYRNMIEDLHKEFYGTLPKRLLPINNYSAWGVIKFLFHVRFATNGNMVNDAAHPHDSPEEMRIQWVYDAVNKKFRKVVRVYTVRSAFNGDHDLSRIGIPERLHLFGEEMPFSKMRSFYSAVVHSYYQKRVTRGYLQNTLFPEEDENEKQIPIKFAAILRALKKKDYIDYWGYVNQRFVSLDAEFKSWFPQYSDQTFDQIESALFGIPPGDAPIIPLEQHLNNTQGNWFASVRYSHVMANHQNLKDATSDILFEDEGRAVGSVFDEVYDQVQPYLSRKGYTPSNPEILRSLSDQYVKDEETARQMGLLDQYKMLEIFKQMLDQRIQQEMKQKTLAGDVFRQWKQKWINQQEDPAKMRQLIINVAVEKFFTGDTVAATKEFAERSEGAHGVFTSTSLDDSLTVYQDNQDVIIGLNQKAGYYKIDSDPRVLKTVNPDGSKVEQYLYLNDGEVANLSFSPSGKIILRTWMRHKGKWRESTQEELAARLAPNAETINGKKNQFYDGPPAPYKNKRRMVEEDFQNISKILAKAQTEYADPQSFNSQSIVNLANRINDTIKQKGKARLRFIGYDNSFYMSEQFKLIIKDLIDKKKLVIDVIDPNLFNEDPTEFDIEPDDIVMMVCKSGATFSTKLALKIIQKLVYEKNIFSIGARIDSVLSVKLGQGFIPGRDKFNKRIFVLGEYYPAETPVASEVLLLFQMQQLAINLTRELEKRNDASNSLGLKISRNRLEFLAQEISRQSLNLSQEITGFDTKGNTYGHKNPRYKVVGKKLGEKAKETLYAYFFNFPFVAAVLSTPLFLLGHYLWPFLGGGALGVALNTLWILVVVPVLFYRIYRMIKGIPQWGRQAPFNLFLGLPPGLAESQDNFFSRILTNRLSWIGPAGVYGRDPKARYVSDLAHRETRGDINLRFALKHRIREGRMGVAQAAYPQTAIYGTKFGKNKPQNINVVVDVAHPSNLSEEEAKLIDNTVGHLGLMIASKTIGVEMARITSFNGRLFNLATTFSSAGAHTTQINPISKKVQDILNSEGVNNNGGGETPFYSNIQNLEPSGPINRVSTPRPSLSRMTVEDIRKEIDNLLNLGNQNPDPIEKRSMPQKTSKPRPSLSRMSVEDIRREIDNLFNVGNQNSKPHQTTSIPQRTTKPRPSLSRMTVEDIRRDIDTLFNSGSNKPAFRPMPEYHNQSMLGAPENRDPGGITMNSNLMNLKITGDNQMSNNRMEQHDAAMSLPVINGFVPQVSGIVTVTPGMLKAMLGELYIN